jgi:hypothetical protein
MKNLSRTSVTKVGDIAKKIQTLPWKLLFGHQPTLQEKETWLVYVSVLLFFEKKTWFFSDMKNTISFSNNIYEYTGAN